MKISKGYRLSVTSWENDGDAYATHTMEGLSERKCKGLLTLAQCFKDGCNTNGDYHWGNQDDVPSEDIEAVTVKINENLGIKEDDDDWVGSDYVYELIGYCSYGDCYRVYERATVEYVPEDIEIESLDISNFVVKL